MSTSPEFSSGNFVPENYIIPTEPEQMQEFLKKTLEEHARFLNRKETAQYEEEEVQVNQSFPGATPQDKRQVSRKIFEFGAIGAGATLVIAHTIVGVTAFTRIYSTCITNVVDYRPIPYTSVVAVNQQIGLVVTAANINIINGAGAPPITSGFVVLEFMKS